MDRQLFKNSYPPTARTGRKQVIFIVLSVLVHSIIFTLLILAPPVKQDSVVEPKPVIISLTFYSEPSRPSSPSPKGSPPVSKPSPEPKVAQPEKEISPSAKPTIPTESPSILKPEQPKPAGEVSSGPPSSAPPSKTVGSEDGKPGGKPEIVQGGLEIIGGSSNPSGPLRPGGNVKDPQRIKYVEPAYPQIALKARIEGTVTLEAIIGRDGRVRNVKVISPPMPLFDQVAIDAVRQWQYTPSVLNGKPIEILLTVIVHFTIK